jgi:glutamyl-tRNA synthetase
MGGRFLLRIEDTDQARSTEASLRIILEGLRWLGLHWDEGPDVGGPCAPYFQMQRLDAYARYAQRLLAGGHAYECFCTPEEVEAGRVAQELAGGRGMYDRRCRWLSAAERARRRAEGRAPSIRAAMPLDRLVAIDDLCKGRIEVHTRELDDWVMVRPDGVPLYNFACVVDDLEMGITHVVRGEEHTMNGIKQVVLFEALDARPPAYAHIPLILGKDGKKLSKREAATNILDYRDQGYPAAAVFNYIALLGWGFAGDRDLFTRDEMVARFAIEQIGKAGARFDADKLRSMCGDYVRQMPLEQLVEQVRPFLVREGVPEAVFTQQASWIAAVVRSEQERFVLYSELWPRIRHYFAEHVELDDEARKSLGKEPQSRQWLAGYAELLERNRDGLGAAELEQQARNYADSQGLKFGQLVHPLRAALTGTTKGAPLFDILALLGRDKATRRLRAV